MIDWTLSMQQTYEYYIVNPISWRDEVLLDKIISSSISYSLNDETLGSASIESTEILNECYIRIYLVCIQGKTQQKFSLGTFLVQTPATEHEGKAPFISMDAYTPLLELKDDKPPFGYTVMKNTSTMTRVSDLAALHCRAPVVYVDSEHKLNDNFIADYQNDTWLSFLKDLALTADYTFGLDELSRIIFSPTQKVASLQPVWEYTDSNSSILYPDFKISRDLYGIPNVVEVLYSTEKGYIFSRVENNEINSPVSIQNRGRVVLHRVSNPENLVGPTQNQLDVYAKNLLEELSVLEFTLTYKHGYCPVRVGDCVLFNNKKVGLNNVKAKVTSQNILCRPGTQVSETAQFTSKLWG